ncbi:hypothetical protein HanPSC8_Chr15g0644411 [Helianthus annuus]|nr:hypothetical protein HanPSC8_Chr15g0644411 [Helianthus annuus]
MMMSIQLAFGRRYSDFRLESKLKWHRSVEVFLLAVRFTPSMVLGTRTLTIF